MNKNKLLWKIYIIFIEGIIVWVLYTLYKIREGVERIKYRMDIWD